MDYQNRAGSKKGGGGIASDAQLNLSRKKNVEDLLRGGEEIPYSFTTNDEGGSDDEQLRKNPYIYKNHSGRLVCKLCNTMHMSWTSVERHLGGKKHGLNLLRRDKIGSDTSADTAVSNEMHDQKFQEDVRERKLALQKNGEMPISKVVKVKDETTGLKGIAVQLDYSLNIDSKDSIRINSLTPSIKIVTGLEATKEKSTNDMFLVAAYEPFDNVAFKIPNKTVVLPSTLEEYQTAHELNEKCTYWDSDSKLFYIQLFFKD